MFPRRVCLALAMAPLCLSDVALSPGSRARSGHHAGSLSACAGERAPVPEVLTYHLRGGAFPGSDRPDVAVHVPPGFDATRRPGLILYFHGWQGCVGAALAATDVPCADQGLPRPGANLIAQVDASRVNAVLVAVEVRADAPTGEPGRMAMPGGARDLLRELFAEKLAEPLGCALDPDALDRVVVVAHSGGYQAAAGVLAVGDLPRITEVDLLDALYGGQDVFVRWIADDARRFDSRVSARLRFVDLYTCCSGTMGPSRSMVARVKDILDPVDLAHGIHDDDGDTDLAPEELLGPVLFKRVARAHSDLPRMYARALLETAGFAPIAPR
jgi:hypothetical protein